MTLQAYIQARLTQPFCWGENDCVLFAIGWLNIRTGKNWRGVLPPWNNAREALRAVQQLGGMETVLDKHLTRKQATAARDGDITLIGRTVLLFAGPHIVAPGKQGLVFLNRMRAPCAWSC